MRTATRIALASDVDTSADLLDVENLCSPREFTEALADVASYTASRTLADINAAAVGAAQKRNPLVVLALCQVAALSFRDLGERAIARDGTRLPPSMTGSWSPSQIRTAFAVIDDVVEGRVKPFLPGATASRPIELLIDDDAAEQTGPTNWNRVDEWQRNGIPYGVLLAQRFVGGSWAAHRNSTANQVGRIVADWFTSRLVAARVSYWRRGTEAGLLSKRELADLIALDGEIGQVSIVTRNQQGGPALAVALAVARDGGSARKSAGRLLELPDLLRVPSALVLVGPGWAPRGETDELVIRFGGYVFSDARLDELVQLARSLE